MVEAKNVGKVFGDVVALDSVDLRVAAGEIVGVIGPSGSGKTTFLRLVLGIYKPTHGSVHIFGESTGKLDREVSERIGYLPQDFVLYDDLTVEENLSFAASIYGMGMLAQRHAIPELLELVHLSEARNRQVTNISGGMRRRLGLACALVHQPDLIILDEPTAGLDPVLRATTWEILREAQQRGSGLIVTTQYVTESEYCDYVYLIHDGRVAATGTPSELRRAAFGGDVVELRIPDLDRALVAQLGRVPYVRRAARLSDDEIELVTDSAAEAIPLLSETVRESGYQLATIEERKVSFDRVFVELVTQMDGVDETLP
jgi:ABC-2 type transport system ATP-binding protein